MPQRLVKRRRARTCQRYAPGATVPGSTDSPHHRTRYDPAGTLRISSCHQLWEPPVRAPTHTRISAFRCVVANGSAVQRGCPVPLRLIVPGSAGAVVSAVPAATRIAATAPTLAVDFVKPTRCRGYRLGGLPTSPAAPLVGSVTQMAGSIVMCFLTVPAEARDAALDVLANDAALPRYPGAVASTAVAFVESEGTQLRDRELILVTAQADGEPTTALAEDFWRVVEDTLFRSGVSAVEHMVAYAVPTAG